MIKSKYKRKNSNFIIHRDPVLHLKEGSVHTKNMPMCVYCDYYSDYYRVEDYSDLFILFFILFYFLYFSFQFYTLYNLKYF